MECAECERHFMHGHDVMCSRFSPKVKGVYDLTFKYTTLGHLEFGRDAEPDVAVCVESTPTYLVFVSQKDRQVMEFFKTRRGWFDEENWTQLTSCVYSEV